MTFTDLESTVSRKCPGCGSNIVYEPKFKSIVCHSCGGVFEVGTLNSKGSFKIPDTGKMLREGQTFKCDSCGAEVETDENTAATTCAFCGSPALVKSRLTNMYRPDAIIPFKVSRKEAEDLFTKFVSGAKRLPADYKNAKLKQKLTGLYVPFWLVDGKVHLAVDASAYRTRTEAASKVRETYAVTRSLDFNLRKVPFDGAKKISDRLMEAIEPFDTSEMIPFDGRLLQGFFAQKYDLTPIDMNERIQDRFYGYAMDEIALLFDGYEEFSVIANEADFSDYKITYCLMPVWFLNYEYNGLYYQFAINGQTGEVAGKLPEKETVFTKIADKIKYHFSAPPRLSALMVFLIACPIVAIIMSLILSSSDMSDSQSSTYIGVFKILAIIALLACIYIDSRMTSYVKHRNVLEQEQEKTTPYELDKRPEVFEYYDGGNKTDIVKEDKLISVMIIAQYDDSGWHNCCIPVYTGSDTKDFKAT